LFNQVEFEVFLDQLLFSLKQKFKYYRTYSAVVKDVNDVQKKGRVGLECLELLAKDAKSYIWALPVGNIRTFYAPKVDDDVILFFKDADPSCPYFIAEPKKDLLVDKPVQDVYTILNAAKTGGLIKYDENEGFTIHSKSQAGSSVEPEPVVLGNKLKELIDYILDSYIKDIYIRLEKIDDDIANHIHSHPMGPTGATLPPAAVNRSTDKSQIGQKKSDISNKKSDYASPGKLLSKVNKIN